MDEVFEALRCCISTKKCNGCPREKTCGMIDYRKGNVEISIVLALDVLNRMKEQPEIVRCKDCRKRNTEYCPDVDSPTRADDWYCADGERSS